MIFELESTECELSFANTVKQFDSGNGDGGGVEVLETEHGTSSGFDAAVVLFNQLFRYFEDRRFVLLGSMSAFCISRTARCEAA
jgi:hypothetical protein